MKHTQATLESQFQRGKTPSNIDGFYKGELLLLLPGNALEVIGGSILHLWLPWKGKTFVKKTSIGHNVIPSYLAPLFSLRFKRNYTIEDGAFQTFPFKTSFQKSLQGEKKVFQLNYDLPENPSRVRSVIDELVEVDNMYLGKAYIVRNNTPRLAAFFKLKKKFETRNSH